MYGRRFGAKYGNTKVNVDGMHFDSKREAARWKELRLMERAGEITDLRRQVRYELIPKQEGERAVHYIADFAYKDKDGKKIVEDAKGVRTREYVIKRKLMLLRYDIRIREV